MGFFDVFQDAGEGIVSAAKGTARALDPTSDLSARQRIEGVGRGALAAGTGGASELTRSAMQKAGLTGKALKGLDPTKKADVATLDPEEAERMRAAQIGNVGGPRAANLQQVNLDTAQSDQARQQQLQALQMQQQAAMGQGPSAASLLAEQQANRIAQQQMAAATARGFNPAAMRGAMYQGAQAQSDAAQQAALARAQEQMAAQQMFGQQAAGLRQADIGQAMGQADLLSQQEALRAQLQQQAGLAGFEGRQQRALTQAQLEQQARLANQAAIEARALGNLGALNQANLLSAQGRQAVFGGVTSAFGDVGAAFVKGGK